MIGPIDHVVGAVSQRHRLQAKAHGRAVQQTPLTNEVNTIGHNQGSCEIVGCVIAHSVGVATSANMKQSSCDLSNPSLCADGGVVVGPIDHGVDVGFQGQVQAPGRAVQQATSTAGPLGTSDMLSV